jgi:hypothetical protein
MDYALLPFATFPQDAGQSFVRTQSEDYEGRADIRDALAKRKRIVARNAIDNLDLLNFVVEALRELPWSFWIDHCHENEGQLRLAVMAEDLGRSLEKEDRVNAGFYLQNSENAKSETFACTRVFRVACRNGALLECEKGQSFTISAADVPPVDWQLKIGQVINRSFSGAGIDVDAARFHATTQQIIVTPYEILCSLTAQELITDEEQRDIQAAFTEAADFSMYGLINAVTQAAHRLRSNDRWARAFHLERLGGQILRGDHNLPALDPVWSH